MSTGTNAAAVAPPLDELALLPARPRLVGDVRLFVMPDGLGFQIHGPGAPLIVRGPGVDEAATYLASALDGTRPLEALLAEKPLPLARDAVVRTLALLNRRGLLRSGPARPEARATDLTLARQLLFWGRHAGQLDGEPDDDVRGRLEGARIVLVATGVFGAATYDLLVRSGFPAPRALAWDDGGIVADAVRAFSSADQADSALARGRSGLLEPPEVRSPPRTSLEETTAILRNWISDADLVVTATRNAPSRLFDAINRLCLESRVPWLRGNEAGGRIDLGPLVLPFESACQTCLRLREASTSDLPIEDRLYDDALAADREAGTTAPLGEALAAATLGASLLALEATRVLTHACAPTLRDRVLSFSPLRASFEWNPLLRVPHCPDCGSQRTGRESDDV